MSDVAHPAPRWDPGARYRSSTLRPAEVEHLAGRLVRGPATRTAVFDRPVWRADLGHGGVATAVGTVVAAYRRGVVDTSGLIRAVGRALGRTDR
jgi:hypothetical protein